MSCINSANLSCLWSAMPETRNYPHSRTKVFPRHHMNRHNHSKTTFGWRFIAPTLTCWQVSAGTGNQCNLWIAAFILLYYSESPCASHLVAYRAEDLVSQLQSALRHGRFFVPHQSSGYFLHLPEDLQGALGQ